MEIYNVGIIGGGAMGAGIAQLIVRQNTPVVIREINDELAQKALNRVNSKLDEWVQKGKMTEDIAERRKMLITTTSKLEDLADCDLVIEAVFERMDVKKKVFAEIDKIAKPEAIFATNTSALSITEMASATNRKDRFIGTHFFNPPTAMKLIELISGKDTSEETLLAVEDFSRSALQKTTIRVKECPGFLVNRLLMPYLNEATLLLQESKLGIGEIDEKVRAFGWPMGPFTLLDFLGIDVAAEVAKILYEGYGERAKAAELMNVVVELKRIGVKGGAGFYIYQPDKGFQELEEILKEKYPNRIDLSLDEGLERMMLGMVNEAVISLEEGVSTASDIETGCLFGIGFPLSIGGPLHYADKLGLDYVLNRLKEFEQKYGFRFKPANLLEKMVSEGKLGEKSEQGFFDYL